MVQDVSRKRRKNRGVTNRSRKRIPETDRTGVIRLSVSASSGKGNEEIVPVMSLSQESQLIIQ